jgi:methyl-accepting chemotaxis protein
MDEKQMKLSRHADGTQAGGANKLFLVVLWALFATSLGLSVIDDTMMLALLAGIPLALLPTVLILSAPHRLATRMSVAAALMLFCALHIHQAHGRPELHFGIFVLLAFLVC